MCSLLQAVLPDTSGASSGLAQSRSSQIPALTPDDGEEASPPLDAYSGGPGGGCLRVAVSLSREE